MNTNKLDGSSGNIPQMGVGGIGGREAVTKKSTGIIQGRQVSASTGHKGTKAAAAESLKRIPSPESGKSMAGRAKRGAAIFSKQDVNEEINRNTYQEQAKEHPNYYKDSKRLAEVSHWVSRTNTDAKKGGEQYPFPTGTWVLRPSAQGERYMTLQYLVDPFTWKNARLEITEKGFSFENRVYKTIEDCVRAAGIKGPSLNEVFSTVREKCMNEQPPYFITLNSTTIKFGKVELTPENLLKRLAKMWDDAKCQGEPPFYYDTEKNRISFHMSMFQLKACGHCDPTFQEFFGSGKVDSRTRFEGFIEFEDPFELSSSSPNQAFRTTMLQHEAHWKISQIKPHYADLSRPEETTPQATLNHWFENNHVEGVFIGEFHDNGASKSFLIENMQRLKEAGVTTLFMEFVEYDGGQKALDAYFQSKDPKMDIPPEVKVILQEYDDHFHFEDKGIPGFMDLVRAAKAAGIRIVGLESEASSLAGYSRTGSGGAERLEALNYNTKVIIDKEKGDGKFIALMGTSHVIETDGVLGMSQMMGLPSMLLFDQNNPLNAEIKTGFDLVPSKTYASKAHASFRLPPYL